MPRSTGIVNRFTLFKILKVMESRPNKWFIRKDFEPYILSFTETTKHLDTLLTLGLIIAQFKTMPVLGKAGKPSKRTTLHYKFKIKGVDDKDE